MPAAGSPPAARTPARLPGTVTDGDPHLTYYHPPDRLSFVWTGNLTDPIHVQHGGYGEPTTALIDPAPLWTGHHDLPADLLTWYRNLCQTWAAHWDGPHPHHDPRSAADPAAPSGGRGACPNRLADGSLLCENHRPHRPGHGCTYTSSTGSWVDDRHDDGGHA